MPAAPATLVSPVSAASSLRVLLVDDFPELCDVARLTLTRAGHTVSAFLNAPDALEHLAADPTGYDLVLTDHHMPTMNGLEFVARLQLLPFTGKILVTTADPQPAILNAYRVLGVHGSLPKPFSAEALRQTVAAFASA